MIEQTISPVIIRRYLDDPEVLEGFNDGQPIYNLDLNKAIYLHADGVGLFPVRTKGKIASFHAAIPPNNRGKAAIKAGKMAIDWLKGRGYFVTCQVKKSRSDVMIYASLCGFKRVGENDHYIFYMAG